MFCINGSFTFFPFPDPCTTFTSYFKLKSLRRKQNKINEKNKAISCFNIIKVLSLLSTIFSPSSIISTWDKKLLQRKKNEKHPLIFPQKKKRLCHEHNGIFLFSCSLEHNTTSYNTRITATFFLQ